MPATGHCVYCCMLGFYLFLVYMCMVDADADAWIHASFCVCTRGEGQRLASGIYSVILCLFLLRRDLSRNLELGWQAANCGDLPVRPAWPLGCRYAQPNAGDSNSSAHAFQLCSLSCWLRWLLSHLSGSAHLTTF